MRSYYSNLLCNEVHPLISKTWEIVIDHHDDACLHIANLTHVTLATMGWKIMNHPPCSQNTAPSDFHSFGPMKVHLQGQILQTEYELKRGVLS
jgi:histone-lysine N-methyltransferase SETMAR